MKEQILKEEVINWLLHRKYTSRNINIAYISIVLLLSGITYLAFADSKTPLQECQEAYMFATNELYRYNEIHSRYKVSLPKYDCTTWTASGAIVPPPERKKNLRDRFWLRDCRFINEKHKLPRYNLEWIAYDIACEVGKSFNIKSPWLYIIEEIGYGNNLWNYIILRWLIPWSLIIKNDVRIVLAHITTSLKEWDTLDAWNIIWQVNKSWASTNYHIHIELWDWYYNVSREFALWEEYSKINWTALLNHRNWDFGQAKENVYYFTSYNLWDINQNDSSPCISASGKDLCELENSGIRTMALTYDIRKKLGVKFWDKVKLTWDEGCEGIYEVHDEMNKRFRETPWILRPWTPYYIKWDIPSKKWWVCHVSKID